MVRPCLPQVKAPLGPLMPMHSYASTTCLPVRIDPCALYDECSNILYNGTRWSVGYMRDGSALSRGLESATWPGNEGCCQVFTAISSAKPKKALSCFSPTIRFRLVRKHHPPRQTAYSSSALCGDPAVRRRNAVPDRPAGRVGDGSRGDRASLHRAAAGIDGGASPVRSSRMA